MSSSCLDLREEMGRDKTNLFLGHSIVEMMMISNFLPV